MYKTVKTKLAQQVAFFCTNPYRKLMCGISVSFPMAMKYLSSDAQLSVT